MTHWYLTSIWARITLHISCSQQKESDCEGQTKQEGRGSCRYYVHNFHRRYTFRTSTTNSNDAQSIRYSNFAPYNTKQNWDHHPPTSNKWPKATGNIRSRTFQCFHSSWRPLIASSNHWQPPGVEHSCSDSPCLYIHRHSWYDPRCLTKPGGEVMCDGKLVR